MAEDKSNIITDAERAERVEAELPLATVISRHRKAVLWSLALSTCIIMEGYDTMLMGNLIAQPEFRRRYGKLNAKGKYEIPSPWQSGLTTGSTCGQLIGLLLSGYLSEKIGLKKTVTLALCVISGMIFLQVFSHSLPMLQTAQVLFGIPLGMLQTTPVVYAMEVAPIALRGYLTTYVNFCWAIGHLLGAGLLRASLEVKGEWSYRMPFALQWFWPALLIPLIQFAPESPWWLVRRDRIDESKAQQKRLVSSNLPDLNEYINQQTALMMVTTQHEREVNALTSYRACFKGLDLRRTLIVIGIYCSQTLSGSPLRSYSTYFLNEAGLPSTQAFNMTIINYAVAFIAGFVAWALLPIVGRRTVYVWSLFLMFCLLILIGGLGIPPVTPANSRYAWAIGSVIIVDSFLYSATMGPLTNTLCVEIPSTLLRSRSIALARWFYAVSGIVAGAITPYQLNSSSWNWGAKTGFFWAGFCAVCVVCAWLFVPETKGRSAADMDLIFEHHISARDSKNAQTSITELV